MATNCVATLWQNYLTPALIALVFRNGMGYRYLNVRINSSNDASISYENFVELGLVTPELTELICEHQVRHGQKTGAFSRICPDILDRFSQSFHRMKAPYMQMTDLYLIFQFIKGRCHGNQIILRTCYQRRLIPLAFVALVLENELQYHGLAERINSGDDGETLSKNMVNFCLVTPEMTELICVAMYLYWAKIDLTPAFVVLPFGNATEYFTLMGALPAAMIRLHLI